MRWESPETAFHTPGPVMGGMRWSGKRPFSAERRRPPERSGRLPGADEPASALPAYAGPVVVTVPPGEARAGEEYVYEAAARDASVDGFAWSLQTAPSGMTVDRYSGRVTWTPSKKCRVRVELCARTVHGHETVQSWTLTVAKPLAVRIAVPHPRLVAALRRKRFNAVPPSLRRPWTVGKKAAAGTACRAAAPPVRPPSAAYTPPLRL